MHQAFGEQPLIFGEIGEKFHFLLALLAKMMIFWRIARLSVAILAKGLSDAKFAKSVNSF
jgi:hypothetical protein